MQKKLTLKSMLAAAKTSNCVNTSHLKHPAVITSLPITSEAFSCKNKTQHSKKYPAAKIINTKVCNYYKLRLFQRTQLQRHIVVEFKRFYLKTLNLFNNGPGINGG